jgi:hypothetical protein
MNSLTIIREFIASKIMEESPSKHTAVPLRETHESHLAMLQDYTVESFNRYQTEEELYSSAKDGCHMCSLIRSGLRPWLSKTQGGILIS